MPSVRYWWDINCIWELRAPTSSAMIFIIFDLIEIPVTYECSDAYLSLSNGQTDLTGRICGTRHPMSFVTFGSVKIQAFSNGRWWWRWSYAMSASYFVLLQGIEHVPLTSLWNVSSYAASSSSINVVWETYPDHESPSNYVVVCIANNMYKNISAATTTGQNHSAVVTNLLKYTEYTVFVLAMVGNSSNISNSNWNETIRKSQTAITTTLQDIPSKPPDDVTARGVGSYAIVVNWSPVESESTNGIIVGYYVYYQVAWTNSWSKIFAQPNKTKVYLKGLKYTTKYRIEVSAATRIGEGPRSRGIFVSTGCYKELKKAYGIFASPNYPNNYPSNANCTWTIARGMHFEELVIMFEVFDIEEGHQGMCSNDYVKILDERGSIKTTACGIKPAFAVVVTKTYATVMLISDGGIEKKGFYAIYSQLTEKDKVIVPIVKAIMPSEITLQWGKPAFSGYDQVFYVLYKESEVHGDWDVIKTTQLNVTIKRLRPSTQYDVKVIAFQNNTTYGSDTNTFETTPVPTTNPAEEQSTTPKPTEAIKHMYSYGLSEGDRTIPYSWEYINRCLMIPFNEDGFLLMTKRHYEIYICRNGILRFESSSYLHWPVPFGINNDFSNIAMLAPYWSLSDRQQAQVFYQVYASSDNTAKSSQVLAQATSDVHRLNAEPLPEFQASWVLVVTWSQLRHSTQNTQIQNLRNTFQAVLITDGVLAFVMYNYPSNGIQWSAPTSKDNWPLFVNDRGLPVVGWSAGSNLSPVMDHFNTERSGTVNIGDFDGIEGGSVYITRRGIRKRSNSIRGKWLFQLYMPWKISRGEKKCKDWFKKQPDPRPFLEYLEPCPCTSRQAWWDERFIPDMSQQGSWWSRSRPCAISTFPSIDGWEQKCCYSHKPGEWGALVVGHPGGGYANRYSRVYDSSNHMESDVKGYHHCCVDSNLCHRFYKKRPSDDCSRYEPPEWSWMWGDPHFRTLDGKNYTFNGLGEYVMLDVKNGYFQLQSRTRLAKGDGTATVFCAAVMKEANSSIVELNLAEDGNISLLIDGRAHELNSLSNETTMLNGSVAVSRPQENGFRATFPSGISVTLTESRGALSILAALPKSFRNKTKGLLGTWNGNKLDDFTTPIGHIVPTNATGRTIHFEFGQQWQVNKTNSLFTYKHNESVSSFSNASFVPMFLDELHFANESLKQQAIEACGSDINCLFDAASTSDVSVGVDTKKVGSQLANDSAILKNNPPRFSNDSGAREIYLVVNVTTYLHIRADDSDGDPIKFNVTGLPTGALVFTNDSTVSVMWDVTMEKINLEFIATDSKGAVAILRPVLHLCACHHGAKCKKNDIQNQNDDRFIVMSCQCNGGYTGQYCESDIDACKVNLNPCYPGVACKDLPAPANESGYECGSCLSGYTGKGDTCQDIDECLDSNHGCTQVCYNTPGSYVCSCKNGFTLNNDSHSCQDINECLPASDCMQNCENTLGSYKCTCDKYFKVDPADSKKCIPESPCKDGNHDCQHICYENNGIASCACRMGYQLQSDKKSCSDVDECKAQKDRCNQVCHNRGGGYDCACVSGFRLSNDNVTCVDINECIEWTFNCSAPLRCENTIGSYKCSCEEGLYWIDNSCREAEKTTTASTEKKTSTSPPLISTSSRPSLSKEHLQNSVNITIDQLNIAEWTPELNLKFKKGVAREVTSFCEVNRNCVPQPRNRRSNNYISFTSDHVIILPGFPIQLPDNMKALIAFYVKYPSGVSMDRSDSIDGGILVNIINGSLEKIEKDIGKTLLAVSSYIMQKEDPRTSITTTEPTSTPKPSEGHPTKDNNLGLIIGVSVAALIVVVITIVVVIVCKRKRNLPSKQRHNDQQQNHLGVLSFDNPLDYQELQELPPTQYQMPEKMAPHREDISRKNDNDEFESQEGWEQVENEVKGNGRVLSFQNPVTQIEL